MSHKEFKFRRGIELGNLEAEDDNLLLKAFVERPEYEILKDTNSGKSILLGRTGSGKSALIRKLESEAKYISRIEPELLSLRHLSNSTIISYFTELGVKLDLFYKVLWKHVLVVELIKLNIGSDSQKNKNIIQWLKDKFSDDRSKKMAIDYLEKWEDKFWETTEYQIQEIEQQLEQGIASSGSFEADFYEYFKLNGELKSHSNESQKVITSVRQKAQSVVSSLQIESLKQIIKILQTDLFANKQQSFYIVIDDLDKDWVDSKIVYDLIRGLIEVLKELRRIPKCKIIIALRTNINQIIFSENKIRGTQREKYNQLYHTLNWPKSDLELLINNRLVELMREKYTKTSPTYSDVLPGNHKKDGDAFDYMIERTLMRPRDLLDFFNKCIKHADGKTKISWESIRKAEIEYSSERLRAIDDEWFENFGSVEVLYNFLRTGPSTFTIESIKSQAQNYFLDVIVNQEMVSLSSEWQIKISLFGDSANIDNLLVDVLIALYEIGVIGIKLASDSSLQYIHEDYIPLREDDIDTSKSRYTVHPMFRKALRIKN